MDNGYHFNGNENEIYPFRALGYNTRDILYAKLGMIVDEIQEYCLTFEGFQLYLHAPDQLPNFDHFIFIPYKKQVFISIKPNVITTSQGLRNYSPEKRGCLFQSERKLQFFRLYSKEKCELECYTNYMKNMCGCVIFSQPGSKDTRICTMTDVLCSFIAMTKFSIDFKLRECNCLPDCTSIEYDTEVTIAQKKSFRSSDKNTSG